MLMWVHDIISQKRVLINLNKIVLIEYYEDEKYGNVYFEKGWHIKLSMSDLAEIRVKM